MKTPHQTIAALLAITIWADGEYSETERFMADEIANTFRIPAADLGRYIADAFAEIDGLDEAAAHVYLRRHASRVHPLEIPDIFRAAIHMVLADGELTSGEVNNLLAISEALGIDYSTATLMLCDMVKADPEIELTYERV
ncbi:MAG: TerB family tellurite resistance protein [Bacteroidales bacterium]|nr:TerB family tellurite resistance protein [Bacteroidales bacterium]